MPVGHVKNADSALISIRPNFAESIMSGAKTIELRRRIPNVQAGLKLWIYSTMPTGAVIGTATIEQVIYGTPDSLWQVAHRHAGLSRVDFDRYFSGTDRGVALRLHQVQPTHHVAIERLRTLRARFHPPQVLVRLTGAEARQLEAWCIGSPSRSRAGEELRGEGTGQPQRPFARTSRP
jgi:predicted transcriptional regulator